MARSFTRANTDKLTVAALVPSSIVSNISLSIWAKMTALLAVGAAQAAFYAGDGANNGCGIFAQSESSTKKWAMLLGGVEWVEASDTLTAGVWTHLAITRSTTGTRWNLYKSGIQDASNVVTAAIQGTAHTSIGDDFTGTRTFGGSLADAAAWNTPLTSNEIVALANGARPYNVRPSNLLGYWPVDGLQSPEPDLAMARTAIHNMTVTGTAFAPGPPIAMFTPRWPSNGILASTVNLTQTHFRYRTDTGAVDATPTWGATEDAA